MYNTTGLIRLEFTIKKLLVLNVEVNETTNHRSLTGDCI